MLEGDRYTHILPGDCISHLQPGSGNDNINAAYNTNTKIINWVKQAVLRGNDLESRGEVLKFFVYIAEVKLALDTTLILWTKSRLFRNAINSAISHLCRQL